MTKVLKWGILGTGSIASKFTGDLPFSSSGQAYAVGSRTKESAEKFAAKFGIPKAYGSYEELANDPEVDAIYVATPHPYHKDNTLACLRAGKAVLCEKPFTINAGELEEVISYARENKLFLMEGMWTRLLPAVVQVKQWLKEGRIGDVLHVDADFGFRTGFNPASRLFDPNLGGGALLDVGIYPVSFASMIFGSKPQSLASTAFLGETGVDEQFTLLLSYEGGKTASLSGAVRLGLRNDAYIYGTEGSIHVPSFFNAHSAALYQNGEAVETFTDDRTSLGYHYEADEVARCLEEGLLESDAITLDESLAIMKLLDEARQQWGLQYPMES
ncbi:Gfo/Idh/MocA family protein [Paenibacillus protaetiae]|uniref:Gfo/Idh/MocA family oxidoreductase n=1 Tax=Paenibacillus protaetiae TaxID=2509456 RepID=A0A4P6ERQ9_9BACL|nr:Gfo/Idh/MocA family oxidoreductase [Paenibacillus protaetiae]QAY65750.1 Gfo/Idh/MocA family oxidoreductase [Paenibacillus protaetiae]